MFAGYLPSTDFTNKIRDHTVKDPLFSSLYKAKPNPQQSSINYRLRRIGSTLSLEERQLHAWGWSACRGIHNIRNLRNSSTKI
jgi:hypothetical protein